MRVVVLVLLVLLAGCANRRAEREALAGQFIGWTEVDLVREGGVPTRAVDAGGRRFLVYEDRRVDLVPGGYGMGYNGWGRSYYGGMMPAQPVELQCDTTFEIVDGKVAAFSLRGNAC